MDKDTALDLLKLDPTEKPEAIETRYNQITAFLAGDAETPAVLKELTGKISAVMTEAYEVLPQVPSKPHELEIGGSTIKDTSKISPSPLAKLKYAIFPKSGMKAGSFLSDQWWNVYRRPVILSLTALAAGLAYLPEEYFGWLPKPTPAPAPNPTPTPTPTPTPAPNPNPGPFYVPRPLPSPSPSPYPIPNPVATPLPGPNTLDPTQDPLLFLFDIFLSIKKAENINWDLKLPVDDALRSNLAIRRDSCPDSIVRLPSGAMKLQSRSQGYAVVRVKEKYFSGQVTINDYGLISDNGAWRLASVTAVGADSPEPAPMLIPAPHIEPLDPNPMPPAVVPSAGDPVQFLIDHVSDASHATYWKAYDHLDAGLKSQLSLDDFKQRYGYGWFVPVQANVSNAVTVESQSLEAAQLRIDPSYFTTQQIKTDEGAKADLVFTLINKGGKWMIQSIRPIAVSEKTRRPSPWS